MSSPALRPRDVTPPDDVPPAAETGGGDGLPALDLVHLTRQTLGDRDLEAELLGLFVHQARALLSLLEAANGRDADPRSWAGTPLHTLCGSARAVGCWQVAAEAEALERSLRGASGTAGPLAAERVARLAAAVNRAVSAIEHVLGE